ncbi:MAG TPA: hypothetical protein VHV57_14150 [Acidimicrobiales bacterium]|jgi:hypothetical protein|nr:hypothetical protein [Acidimicrobiales bacterium]
MSELWPQANVGNVGRLRALAAGFPGSAYTERHIPVPFEQVWDYFSDMERSVPSFDETVAEFHITNRDDNRLTAKVRGPFLPIRFTLDVDLDVGWCLMTARPAYYLVMFAAEPSGDHTRFAHAEACNLPGPTVLRRPIQPLFRLARRWLVGHVERDVDGLELALGLTGDK